MNNNTDINEEVKTDKDTVNELEESSKPCVKVSVIMPIYNAYDYLRPAIESVLDQTLTEIELICIDDGSTDNSYELIKEYQQKDERVRIVTETNAGPSLARNNGIKRARGEYIAFLDADDFFEPTLLEKLYTAAVEKDLDIAITEYDIYNSHKATFENAQLAEYEDIFTENGYFLLAKQEDIDYTDGRHPIGKDLIPWKSGKFWQD